MWKTTIKGLLAHKFRLVSTMLSIVMGVSLISGSMVLTDTVARSFDDLFADLGRGTDVVVRSQSSSEHMGEAIRGPVDQTTLDAVRRVPGVQALGGNVQGYAQLVGKDGKAIGNPGNGAPTLGLNWPDDGLPNSFDLVSGNSPRGPTEVVIDKASADKGGFSVGDTATVLTRRGPVGVTVVGVAKFGSVDSPVGASVSLFETAAAQQLVGTPGGFDAITVVAEPGTSQSDLAGAVQQVLPAGVEAVTGEAVTVESQDAMRKNLAFFNSFFVVFAVVALFVGAFIVHNTFSIIVSQRTRELALLRALGATRRQVRRSVIVEATIVGLVASGVGMVAGMGTAAALRALMETLGFEIPSTGSVVTSKTVIVSVLAGLVTVLWSSVSPARKAAKVPPIAALRSVSVDRSAGSKARIAIGALVTAAGTALLLVGLFAGGDNAMAPVGVGAAVMFLGVAALGPALAKPVVSVIGWPVAKLRGISGQLARGNAVRNPKRTSSTASALMIGVALVGFISIFAASAKASFDKVIDQSFHGDLTLDAGTRGFGGISPVLATSVRGLAEVEDVTSIRLVSASVGGAGQMLTAVQPSNAETFADLGEVRGSVRSLSGHGVAISQDVAKERNWNLGDVVQVTFPSGERSLTVEAVYEAADLVGGYVIGMPLADVAAPTVLDAKVFVIVRDGVSVDAARQAVEQLTKEYPNVVVSDLTEFKAEMAKPIDQMLSLIYAMLLLAVIIAVLGIVNTLALSTHERTRELGLLRAVGMSRRQVRTSVRWESVLIALFGTVLGLGIGSFFGWAIVRSLASEGFSVLAIPGGQLGVVSVLAAVAGVGAAILPARRAARLDVLRAIATD